MPRRFLFAAALLTLTACSDGARQLAEPSGPIFRLNPERWADSAVPGRAATR